MTLAEIQLRRARAELRRTARRDYPRLLAVNKIGPSIEAACKVAGVDLEGLLEFSETVVRDNGRVLKEGTVRKRIAKDIVLSAFASGVLIGVMAERKRNGT